MPNIPPTQRWIQWWPIFIKTAQNYTQKTEQQNANSGHALPKYQATVFYDRVFGLEGIVDAQINGLVWWKSQNWEYKPKNPLTVFFFFASHFLCCHIGDIHKEI